MRCSVLSDSLSHVLNVTHLEARNLKESLLRLALPGEDKRTATRGLGKDDTAGAISGIFACQVAVHFPALAREGGNVVANCWIAS